MASPTTITINQGYEIKTSKSGKTRFTLRVEAEPLIHDLDPKRLSAEPAKAVVEHLKSRIERVSEEAAPNTIRARLSAQKALVQGKEWAMKRYSGGRTGTMAPATSTRLFNDSGRITKLFATYGEGAWRINVPANRFDGGTLDHGGDAAVAAIYRRLVQLVPELGDSGRLVSTPAVAQAIQKSVQGIIRKEKMSADDKALEIAMKVIEIANQVGEIIEAA